MRWYWLSEEACLLAKILSRQTSLSLRCYLNCVLRPFQAAVDFLTDLKETVVLFLLNAFFHPPIPVHRPTWSIITIPDPT